MCVCAPSWCGGPVWLHVVFFWRDPQIHSIWCAFLLLFFIDDERNAKLHSFLACTHGQRVRGSSLRTNCTRINDGKIPKGHEQDHNTAGSSVEHVVGTGGDQFLDHVVPGLPQSGGKSGMILVVVIVVVVVVVVDQNEGKEPSYQQGSQGHGGHKLGPCHGLERNQRISVGGRTDQEAHQQDQEYHSTDGQNP